MLCLKRACVYDKLYFFYAYGNTAPAYLFYGDATRVLLLASGDIRSALYSMCRDSRRSSSAVHFTVNDADEHVVARNVLLVWLANHAAAEHVFAIWFSLGLTPEADAALREALDALTRGTSTDAMELHATVGITYHLSLIHI